jgi:hypothetical protein
MRIYTYLHNTRADHCLAGIRNCTKLQAWMCMHIFLVHVISPPFVWVKFSFLTLFMTIFSLGFLQELGCLLWFILISCGCISKLFLVFLYFYDGSFWLAHHQKNSETLDLKKPILCNQYQPDIIKAVIW